MRAKGLNRQGMSTLAFMESPGLNSAHRLGWVTSMARSVKDIENEIRELSREEKTDLVRSLIAELDRPADVNVKRAWLETAQRRYRELVEA